MSDFRMSSDVIQAATEELHRQFAYVARPFSDLSEEEQLFWRKRAWKIVAAAVWK